VEAPSGLEPGLHVSYLRLLAYIESTAWYAEKSVVPSGTIRLKGTGFRHVVRSGLYPASHKSASALGQLLQSP